MRRHGFDLLLILTLILVAGTIVQDFRFDASLTRERASALSTLRDLGSVDVSLADARAAQAGYLAVGQEPDTWMTRVTELSAQLETTLTKLKGEASTTALRARYEEGLSALAAWVAVDRRARDEVKRDQRFTAADLMSMEGAEAQRKLADAMAAARLEETTGSASRSTRLAQLRLGMHAATLAFVLIVAWRANRVAASRQPASEPASMAQMLRDLPPPVKLQTPASPGTAARITAPVLPTVNLPGAADLCVDLARLLDGRDVPALLERAAGVLEAKGVIIWSADMDGLELRPSLTFGYPEKVVARLGGLPTDADNVTSLAFRSGRPQTMNGSTPGAAGAVAVPLITASGTVGVFAAEVKATKPAAEHVAIARIIAAQFSTLVAPAESASAVGHRAG